MLRPVRSSPTAVVALLSTTSTSLLRAQDEPTPTPSQVEAAPSPVEPSPRSVADDKLEVAGLPVRGSFSWLYRLRHTSCASDQDVYGLLATDVGDFEEQPFTLHVVARAAYDLDGHTNQRGAYAFDSLADTYGRRLTAQLQEAWAGGTLAGPVARWRLGRMFLDDTPVQAYFDGARIDSAAATAAKLEVGAYGGVPSHLYESSPDGDAIVGGFVASRPWNGTKARLDAMHVDDRNRFGDQHDDLLGASLWQTAGDHADAFGRMTWLDREARDLSLRARWTDAATALTVQASYRELFTTQRDHSYELDPFFEAAFDYFPYRQVGLRASKGLGDHVDLAAGADVRRLVSRADTGPFNHDFERYFVTPTLIGLPDDQTAIAFTGEWWNGSEDHFATVGCDVSHTLTPELRVRAGSNYALWKYDLDQNRELDRVRTWLVGLDWKSTKTLRLRGDYSYEDSDLGRFHTLRMRATWTF